MKTKTIELYEFDELSESAKAKVLEAERDINVEDSFWHKYLLEEWEQELESMGFEDPTISFTGFWSQGDGASFTSKNVDIEKFLTSQKARGRFKAILKALKSDNAEVNASVDRIDYHYSHEYTVRASVEVLTESVSDDKGDEFAEFLNETVRTLSRKIYRELEAEHEYLTSDESVIDTIKANEYTFTASGKMENV